MKTFLFAAHPGPATVFFFPALGPNAVNLLEFGRQLLAGRTVRGKFPNCVVYADSVLLTLGQTPPLSIMPGLDFFQQNLGGYGPV